jgi:hypothetical protein
LRRGIFVRLIEAFKQMTKTCQFLITHGAPAVFGAVFVEQVGFSLPPSWPLRWQGFKFVRPSFAGFDVCNEQNYLPSQQIEEGVPHS